MLACSPFLVGSSSMVQFLGKCMCYSIVAIALDLIWGYTGMLSLGHGIYFCLGGYAMAMYLRLRDNGGALTDFMQTGGLTKLPFFWKPFLSFPLAVLLVILVPGTLAAVIGYFVFRSRIKGVYFSIITQALTWAAYSLFIANSKYTGGNNGITDFTSVFGSTRGAANRGHLTAMFFVALTALVLVYLLASWLVNSKFGKLLIAIRDGENRTFFSGYCVNQYKNSIYTLSAVIAGIGGALFVNFNGSITPSQMTIAYFAQRGLPPVILHKRVGIRKNRIVKGIPIFMMLAGIMKIPRILNSHAKVPTPAHTARHLAAYWLASASFSRSAFSSMSVFIFVAFVFLYVFKPLLPDHLSSVVFSYGTCL